MYLFCLVKRTNETDQIEQIDRLSGGRGLTPFPAFARGVCPRPKAVGNGTGTSPVAGASPEWQIEKDRAVTGMAVAYLEPGIRGL